ncbi:hypothetical protein E3O44_12685 [Cryobacterium algoricola]|uniref:Tape measure protein N-terminal domain-containing protein n=1 Tax=Cryobacterium algoricola TaxID=1259183 RepID=A0ABY2IB66_9MICO|nr:tape measure protein [Cryobacterium algoricola]TFB85852.1 hypothetical protein E3O44_12685 [Cryobacterium algoricola]
MAQNRIGILIETKESGSKAASDVVSKSLNGVTEAANSSSRATQAVGDSFSSQVPKASGFSDSLARIRDVALGVYLPQLGLKLLELGKDALTSTGNFEQSRVAFETMLGSADKAQTMLTQISQFAKETPFTLDGVVDASKQLLAYGFAQDEVLPTMRKLGDVAAGVSVPIGQLTGVYGQVRVAGKLMGQDLLQFTQAGVPLLDYLSQTMHKTTANIKKDMEAGVGPTFKDVQAALEAMTASGSKFGGLMDKQSHTFQGVMSNIGDSFGQIGRAALGMDTAGNIVKGSFFDRIKNAAASAMPVLQDFATKVGPAVQDGLNGLIDFGKKVSDGVKWVTQYSDEIKITAIVLTTLFAPAIVGAAVKSTVSAATMVASAFQARTAWIVSAVQVSAAWWTSSIKLIAFGVTTAAKSGVSAGITSATWVSSAVVTSSSWLLHMAKVSAAGALVALKAAPYAADTALAWTINAVRVSFVWVTQELPKLIAGFVVTSVQAAIHAAAVSASWIASAAVTSFTWVTTELPKIVMGFVITSAGAIAQAAVTSAAWIASASTSSIAWVVTELPKIVGAFIAMSASAVVQATVASAAWIASAVASSQSVAALQLLVATPMIMPAIVVAAAVASLVLVIDAANRAKAAIDGAQAAQDKDLADSTALIRNARVQFDQGKISGGELSRLLKIYSNALGTNSSPGGQTLVGEHGPEIVDMPKGAVVTPAYRTRSEPQAQSSNGGMTITGGLHVYNNLDEQKFLAKIGWRLALA